MNKIAIVKNVASFVVGAGASRIVSGIIKNNTDPEKLHDQIAIASATVVLGSMVAKATKAHTDAMIDETVAAFHKMRDEINKKINKEEESEETETPEDPEIIEGTVIESE